jgi:hypothetical protein
MGAAHLNPALWPQLDERWGSQHTLGSITPSMQDGSRRMDTMHSLRDLQNIVHELKDKRVTLRVDFREHP